MSEVQSGRSEVDREPWFWRAIPLRQPPWTHALLVTTLVLGLALGLRLAVIGFPAGMGPSSTFFPAFIVATLFAGPRWGWVIATNVYLKTVQGWRLVVHHASPGTANEMQEATAAAGVLH